MLSDKVIDEVSYQLRTVVYADGSTSYFVKLWDRDKFKEEIEFYSLESAQACQKEWGDMLIARTQAKLLK